MIDTDNPSLYSQLADRIDPELEEMRQSYLSFAPNIKQGYDLVPHIELVIENLIAVERGEIDRLMVGTLE